MTPPRSKTKNPQNKLTLTCPNCEHTAPITGDWNQNKNTDKLHLKCPDCQTDILNQNLPPEPET